MTVPGWIDRRGKGRWRARYRDPGGRERSRTFERKIDAQRWLMTVEVDKSRGTWVDPAHGRMPLGTWLDSWLMTQSHLKPATRTRYGVAVRNQILPTWRRVPLQAIAYGDVVAWLNDLLGSGLAPATVRYAYRVFSLTLDGAVRDNRIARNPALGVKLPRIAPTDKVFLNHSQVDALAEACGNYGLFVRLLAYTGLRWGEATALRVRRVDLLRNRLEVAESASEHAGRVEIGTPKSHHRRSVPLPGFLADQLAEHVNGKPMNQLVFTAPDRGPLRNSNFRRDVFDRAAVSVGLRGLKIHDLRHTAASLAIGAGANVKAVQLMLGHASAAMTLDVYAGLFPDDLDALAARLHEAATRPAAASQRPGPANRLLAGPPEGDENAV